MDKIFLNNIGDLGEAQRASFYRFLSKGITEEFGNFPNPFTAKIMVPTRSTKRRISCFVYIYPTNLKLKGPTKSINKVLKDEGTYAIQFYIPGEYSYSYDERLDDKKVEKIINQKNCQSLTYQTFKSSTIKDKKIHIKQDILFGEIPLMTEEGTFIINGYERVIIGQIIRSPGVYFKKEFTPSGRVSYFAQLISNKGIWTKIYFDHTINKITREPEPERIYIDLRDSKIKTGETKDKKDEDKHKLFIYDIIRYFGLTYQEIRDSLKYPLHFEKNHQLTRGKGPWDQDLEDNEDMGIDILRLFSNQRGGCFSIGESGRYKINKRLGLNLPKNIHYLTSHDFLAIIDGLIELKYYDRTSDDIDHMKNKQVRFVGDLLQNQIRIGLYRLQKNISEGLSPSKSPRLNFELQTYSDPNDWIVDPRTLSTTIKDFFKTSQLSQFMDQINPLAEITHKRRITVFGPNGLKRDHISTSIRDIHPSQYGRLCPIETPEGQNAGLISSLTMYSRVSSLGWIETPYFVIDNDRIFCDKRPIFLNPEQESETKVGFCDISLDINNRIEEEYLSVKENYSFSVKKQEELDFITTSPLQIMSLATALIPFVEHDDANRALMGSNMQRQAVPLMHPQKPIVGTGLEVTAILDSGLMIKSYCEGIVIHSSSRCIIVEDLTAQKIVYCLRKYGRSNQETAINQSPLVWEGERVFSGQIIADGPSTSDGELSLGRNLLIAYMPWEGYNYEDAIVINERLITEDCLTSIHIEELESNLNYSVNGSEKLTKKLPHLTSYVKRHLDKNGIVKIGSYVNEHDILIGKLTPCEEDTSPEAKLLKALYGQKKPSFRDSSLRVGKGVEGRVVDIRVLSKNLINKDEASLPTFCETIKVYIAQIRKVHIGDKLAGRHGNKGIISRVLSVQDMPYLPDGTPIDIIFNPLGVPSRMNVGQIFECLLGLAGEKLGNRFKITPFDEVYGQEASRLLVNQKLKEAAIKTNTNWLFSNISPGKVMLRDGRTGEYFDNPVTVGKSYILKLIHLVEDKIHARATGPYSMITEQPLAGKAQNGGQRFGEMEVWALEAYGCAHTLQELMTIKSDDVDGRNDIYETLLVRKEMEKPTPSITESFLTLMRELHSLGLDFGMMKVINNFGSTGSTQQIEKDIFQELEQRLKLRALLARRKAEEYALSNDNIENSNQWVLEKMKEQSKILDRLKSLDSSD